MGRTSYRLCPSRSWMFLGVVEGRSMPVHQRNKNNLVLPLLRTRPVGSHTHELGCFEKEELRWMFHQENYEQGLS